MRETNFFLKNKISGLTFSYLAPRMGAGAEGAAGSHSAFRLFVGFISAALMA